MSDSPLTDAESRLAVLRDALEKIAAHDPGMFRPLVDEIRIWKIATDALRQAAGGSDG